MVLKLSDFYHITVFCVLCEHIEESKQVHKSEINLTGTRKRCDSCGAYMMESIDPVFETEEG